MTEAVAAAPASHGRLQWRLLIGFIAGLVLGLLVYSFARDAAWVDTVIAYVTGPIGQIFLRLLFMLVLPLLFSALVIGIAEMGEIRALKRVGIATLIYTVIVSGIAVALSLFLVNLLQPGKGVAAEIVGKGDAFGTDGIKLFAAQGDDLVFVELSLFGLRSVLVCHFGIR